MEAASDLDFRVLLFRYLNVTVPIYFLKMHPLCRVFSYSSAVEKFSSVMDARKGDGIGQRSAITSPGLSNSII